MLKFMDNVNLTLEESFARDFLKRTKEEKQQRIEHATKQTLDPVEYAETVGYIRGLSDSEVLIENLLNTYFPRD